MERIQDILGAFLSVNGQHDAAAEAYQSTTRTEWLRLGELAMRSAPREYHTDTCRKIKLALDAPENGGKGVACDFTIYETAHPMQVGQKLYRARISGSNSIADGADAGFASPEISKLIDRLVGMYVVRSITGPDGKAL